MTVFVGVWPLFSLWMERPWRVGIWGMNKQARNRSQSRCFTPFYSVSVYLCITLRLLGWTVKLSFFCVWNANDPKRKFSFYVFIMNNKFSLCLLRCVVLYVVYSTVEYLWFLTARGLFYCRVSMFSNGTETMLTARPQRNCVLYSSDCLPLQKVSISGQTARLYRSILIDGLQTSPTW